MSKKEDVEATALIQEAVPNTPTNVTSGSATNAATLSTVTQTTQTPASQTIIANTAPETSTPETTNEQVLTSNDAQEITIEEHVGDVLSTGKYYGWELNRKNTQANSEKVHVCFRTPTL